MTAVWAYYRHIYEEWGEKGKEGGYGEGGKKEGRKRRNKESVRKPR